MGTNLPNNFTDGQELEASELNKMLTSRTDSILPIDDTTRNNTDLAGSLGNATNRYTEAHIDNIKIDGNTISSTDTDGDINLTPDGAGGVRVNNQIVGSGVVLGSMSKNYVQGFSSGVISLNKFVCIKTCEISRIGFMNGEATSSIKLALYSDNAGYPNTLLYSSDAIYLTGKAKEAIIVDITPISITKDNKYYIGILTVGATGDRGIGTDVYGTGFVATGQSAFNNPCTLGFTPAVNSVAGFAIS